MVCKLGAQIMQQIQVFTKMGKMQGVKNFSWNIKKRNSLTRI